MSRKEGSSQVALFGDFAKRSVKLEPRVVRQPVKRLPRVKFIALCASAWSFLVVGRLFQLQIAEHHNWQGTAEKQHASVVTLASERGPIYDRNGRLLATSVPGGSIYARPRQIKNKAEVAKRLAALLERSEGEVHKLISSSSPFVWLERQVPRPLAVAAEELKIPGVGYMIESRRYYPYGSAASTLIGKVGVDGNGLSGIEGRFERHLASPVMKTPVSRDGVGKLLQVSYEPTDLPKGKPLSLTLDASLQLMVEEELELGRKNAQAERAYAVMMNSVTGEILALAQHPSPNFNHVKLNDKRLLENQVLQLAFEPGSIMKPIVAALALEEGVTDFHEMIDCERGSFRYGGHTINDVHPSGIITTFEVVVRSSNIGMTKLGSRLGRTKIYEGLTRFGFGSPSGLPFPGESSGLFRKPESWYPIDVATHSFGQGIAVTPLQVVRAISALANGGILPPVSLVSGERQGAPERILSSETAELARQMLIGVVEEKGGTGSRAKVPGIIVGGKTGTAQRPKENGRGYEAGDYIASFVGFGDGSVLGVPTPITLLVVIDRPRADFVDGGRAIYGGVVAAPVFKRILHRAMNYLSTAEEGYTARGERSFGVPEFPELPLPRRATAEGLPQEPEGASVRFVSYQQ